MKQDVDKRKAETGKEQPKKDESSPLLGREKDESNKVREKRSHSTTRDMQAGIETEERREYREESQKEKQKKTKDEKRQNQSVQTSSMMIPETATPKKPADIQNDRCNIVKKMEHWRRDYTLADFFIGRPLGHEINGTLFAAKLNKTNLPLTIKVVFKEDLETTGLARQFNKELSCHYSLQHQNILYLHSVLEDSLKYFVFTEFAQNGTLEDYLSETGKLREEEARIIFRQVCQGLGCFHRQGTLHRDIRPKNIFISDDGMMKVGGFTWSTITKGQPAETRCGPMESSPPEKVGSGTAYDDRADVWSLGVLLYQMLSGKVPFEGNTALKLTKNIQTSKFVVPENISSPCANILYQMLRKNPEDRPTVTELVQHTWLTERCNAVGTPTLNTATALEPIPECKLELTKKGNVRRAWTKYSEDVVIMDDSGCRRHSKDDKPVAMLKTRKSQLQKRKGKKSGDTVLVEPEEKLSPISIMEKNVSSETVPVEKKRPPLATRNKQARIEAEERREYREEPHKEKQKKTKDEKKPDHDVVKKTGIFKALGKVVVNKLLKKKQKTLTDEQRIRASKDPRLADLLTRVERTANNLNSHYQNLVILDNFPKEKKDDLKKMADDIRRLNNQR